MLLTQESGFRSGKWDEDDPVLSKLTRSETGRYEGFRDLVLNSRKKYGNDRIMAWYNKDEHEGLEYEEGETYTNSQMEHLADQMLREYGKRELCRVCLDETGDEFEGQETGKIENIPQFKDGVPVVDGEGTQLVLAFPELRCENGHVWFQSEGKARSNSGKNPILFEEHLIQRKRREIYTTEGVPDPNIVSGMYNRVHPQGRKVNTNKQRKDHGASFYR